MGTLLTTCHRPRGFKQFDEVLNLLYADLFKELCRPLMIEEDKPPVKLQAWSSTAFQEHNYSCFPTRSFKVEAECRCFLSLLIPTEYEVEIGNKPQNISASTVSWPPIPLARPRRPWAGFGRVITIMVMMVIIVIVHTCQCRSSW